jgi:hypothetical protein
MFRSSLTDCEGFHVCDDAETTTAFMLDFYSQTAIPRRGREIDEDDWMLRGCQMRGFLVEMD